MSDAEATDRWTVSFSSSVHFPLSLALLEKLTLVWIGLDRNSTITLRIIPLKVRFFFLFRLVSSALSLSSLSFSLAADFLSPPPSSSSVVNSLGSKVPHSPRASSLQPTVANSRRDPST